jgi:hypothetical protein
MRWLCTTPCTKQIKFGLALDYGAAGCSVHVNLIGLIECVELMAEAPWQWQKVSTYQLGEAAGRATTGQSTSTELHRPLFSISAT